MTWRLLASTCIILASLAPHLASGGRSPGAARRAFDAEVFLRDVYTRYGRGPSDTWLSTVDDSYSEGRYSGWVLLSVCCVNSSQQPHSQQELLNQLLVWQRDGVVTITDDGLLNGRIQMAVAPPVYPLAKEKLEDLKLDFEVVSEDLEELISSSFSRFRASKTVVENFFELHEVEDLLKELQRKYPDQVKLKVIGESFMKRPILEITVLSKRDVKDEPDGELDDEEKNRNVPIILIDSAMHAREWLSVATSLHALQTLLEDPPSLLREVEWRFIPVANPDGYFYSWEKNRLWRKNRRPHPTSPCVGVDLNRNFDVGFGGVGSSNEPCSNEYHGESAFSEPEAQAVRDAVHEAGDRLKMYLSLHCYGQLFLLPWAYSHSARHDNLKNMTQLAQGMADAIQAVNDTKYFVGTTWEGLYPASGISSDWVAAQGIPNSLVIELQDQGRKGFLYPESEIEQAVTETWEGIKFMGEEIWRRYVKEEYGELSPNIAPVRIDDPVDVNAAVRDRIISLLQQSALIIANAEGQNTSVERPGDVSSDQQEPITLLQEAEDLLTHVESLVNDLTGKRKPEDLVTGVENLPSGLTDDQEITKLVEEAADEETSVQSSPGVPSDNQELPTLVEDVADEETGVETPPGVPSDNQELPTLVEDVADEETGVQSSLGVPSDNQELPSLVEDEDEKEDSAAINATQEIAVATPSSNSLDMETFVQLQNVSSEADDDEEEDDDATNQSGAVSIVTLFDKGTSDGVKNDVTEVRNATANTQNDLNFVLLEDFVPQVVSWSEKLVEECKNDTNCKISSYIKNVLENQASRPVVETSEIPESVAETATEQISEEKTGRKKFVWKLV